MTEQGQPQPSTAASADEVERRRKSNSTLREQGQPQRSIEDIDADEQRELDDYRAEMEHWYGDRQGQPQQEPADSDGFEAFKRRYREGMAQERQAGGHRALESTIELLERWHRGDTIRSQDLLDVLVKLRGVADAAATSKEQ